MFYGFAPEVRDALLAFLQRNGGRRGGERKVAVFDADGTLWRGDVGEAFFKHQIERQTMPHAPKKDPWGAYQKVAYTDRAAEAYAWLAQWNAGVEDKALQRWCDQFFHESFVTNVFTPMRELTHALLNAGFEVWVVSASMRWIVSAGVQGFGIHADRVIGVNLEVEQGRLTDKLADIVPFRAGKAKLIEKIIGEKPLLAAGNTFWDKEMLSTATEIALAIHSEQAEEPNHESEQKLKRLAQSNSWLVQRF